ncbi:TPA: tRNA uridine-5-carboxymethylaminomethyl(34) synthesis enzyme MnmG [bacterium]|jgi:tRNA uridine 5-carboxymethylaminomethyl modification enzyme|nr:tRNA uridine-5-carboxymethylaminomethyl(34) synthesis enzyme MnmG [bacterium]
MTYDIIVVGGGHAGVEAVLATARLGYKTLLVTLDFNHVASMPCNPSIGGPAKGVVVREIDALGGEMGKASDATYLQMKMLNTGKGVGVQTLRAQIDKIEYMKYMQQKIKEEPNITVIETMAVSLIIEDGVCKGIKCSNNEDYYAKATILTTGTYLESNVLIGHTSISSGPEDQPSVKGLSASLRSYGIPTLRLKTGTPARVYRDSIDFSKMEVQHGTPGKLSFSFETNSYLPIEEQWPCYLIHTTPTTHEIIRENLGKSAMYGGLVTGVGPRYCPSIEDKITRFADKERHQLFIEPESRHLDTIYLQGFSTSMPKDVQEEMVHSLPGLENARIKNYAYAIEYDAIDPTELYPNLELKKIAYLFCAGQINGTSGYEEAAAQGLMAGINAVLKLQGKEPFILRRDEAYIGVLIDDLVTKGVSDPYRLLTSRAEYRLLLRHDNADIRLRKHGYNVGLVKEDVYQKFVKKLDDIKYYLDYLKNVRFTYKHPLNEELKRLNLTTIEGGISAYDLLKRPHVTISLIEPHLENFITNDEVKQQLEIQIKYEGYINKQIKEAETKRHLEKISLPIDLDYLKIDNLALEARQKLDKIRPLTIGQASRISGVNPSDISILLIYLKSKGLM